MAFSRLHVSGDGRRLIRQDGTAFFYLADTAWELFHRLNRQDILTYLDDRAEKGFTAIQAVALSEFDGLRAPNAYGRRPLRQGDSGEYDPRLPDDDGPYSYWAHVDFAVRAAEERGLYIALLPTWGDKFNSMWGKGPEIFTPENAFAYGAWIGQRYAAAPNLIWILGGDRALLTRRHFEIVCEMARGIRSSDRGVHLMTFHPTGGKSSSESLHGEDWLDFNMIQSGHTRSRYNYEMIRRDYARSPAKPVLDGEPGYEDHPESFDPKNGYMDAADTRQFAYMSLFSGACGHTYGDHSIWSMLESLPSPDFPAGHFCLTWRQALSSPGSGQMRHAKSLLLSRDFLSAAPRPDRIVEQLGGVLYIPVLEGRDYLLAYTAQGMPVQLKAGCLGGRRARVSWYDPRLGQYTEAGDADCASPTRFVPPSGGRGNDWVLALDAL